MFRFLSFKHSFNVCNAASIIKKHPAVGQLYALIFKALPILLMHYKQPLKCKWMRNPLSPPAGASLCSLGIGLLSFTLNQSLALI